MDRFRDRFEITVGSRAMKCAEATTTARGRRNEVPRPSRNRPVGEFSSGIIGEPWDRKSEGSELGVMWQRPGLNVSSHASRRH